MLSLGINDISLVDGKLAVSTSESIANTTSILKEAGRYYEVMMVGPPPVLEEATSLRIRKLSIKLNEACRKIGLRYIDIYAPLMKSPTYLEDLAKGDGYHPSATGYSEIARLIGETGLWWY